MGKYDFPQGKKWLPDYSVILKRLQEAAVSGHPGHVEGAVEWESTLERGSNPHNGNAVFLGPPHFLREFLLYFLFSYKG